MCPVVSGFFPKSSHPKFEVLMGECSWVGGKSISHQSNPPTLALLVHQGMREYYFGVGKSRM